MENTEALVSELPKVATWSLSGSKRLFDVACAAVLVTAAAPIMLMLALLVKVTSPGPALFRHNRVGRNGKEFPVLKFRTMHCHNGNTAGAVITRAGDCRITTMGRWLRQWKLDELPQLLNVIRGDMSLVGPRPDVRQCIERLSAQDRDILYFRPGITSPASLKFRNEEQELAKIPVEEMEQFYIHTLLPQKVRTDLDYEKCATFSTDCRILLLTIFRVLRRNH